MTNDCRLDCDSIGEKEGRKERGREGRKEGAAVATDGDDTRQVARLLCLDGRAGGRGRTEEESALSLSRSLPPSRMRGPGRRASSAVPGLSLPLSPLSLLPSERFSSLSHSFSGQIVW